MEEETEGGRSSDECLLEFRLDDASHDALNVDVGADASVVVPPQLSIAQLRRDY